MTRIATLRRGVALILAVLVLAIGAWIRLTPFNALTHTLSVGSAEVAPWLIAGAMLALVLVMPEVRRRWTARIAAVLAVGACVLPTGVIVQIDPAYREIDRAFQNALRGQRAPRLPILQLMRLRDPSFSFPEAFGWRTAPIDRESHDVQFARRDNVTLTMEIYRPEIDQHGAAVIQFYGGGWRSGAPTANADFARELTRLGYVVFAPDYRHAPAARWPAQLTDAREAIAWVTAHGAEYGADASKIVLVGRSSGAQLALVSGITDATAAIRGIVALYSPVDLTDGYLHPTMPDLLGTRALESSFIGATLEENPAAYRDASPITYANRPHPPVLMINGGRDFVIERRVAQRLRSRLAESGMVIFLELPWAGHAFDTVPFGPGGQVELSAVERFLVTVTAE
ncbi:MAG: alpha/beta hydrolase [Acidobacteriota bacterium]